MYLHDDASLFEEAAPGAAAELSASEGIVAKGHCAMMMLKEVTSRDADPVFKGGARLSKRYGIIERFSEDADSGISLVRAAEGMGRAIKRAVVDSADDLGIEVLNLAQTGSRREYTSTISSSKALPGP